MNFKMMRGTIRNAICLGAGVAMAFFGATTQADIVWTTGAPSGTSGGAINFDGVGQQLGVQGGTFLDTGIAASGIGTGDYTISFWAQHDAIRGNARGDWIVGTGGGGETGATQGIHVGTLRTGGNGSPIGARQGHWGNDSSGTSVIGTGTWNHYTFQYDADGGTVGTGAQIISVNGVFESTTDTGAPNMTIGNFILGHRNNGSANNDTFRGSLDDVAFFNEVISSQTISDIFNGTTTEVAAGADAYYDFEDSQFGTTAAIQGTGELGGAALTGIIANAVPEPSSMAVLIGLGAFGVARRKRR